MVNKDPEKIEILFDEISTYYDKMNNIISLGMHYIIKFLALKTLNIQPNEIILDVCCGTGDFSNLISKFYPKSKVIGLDFSQNMIKFAKHKSPKNIFIQGDCTNLPFKDEEFDHVIISFGLRNIQDRGKAIKEMYRVLKKNGTLLHLDFGRHTIFLKIFNFYIPLIAKILHKNPSHYEYLKNSINEFPEANDLVTEFGKHSFKLKTISNYLFKTLSAQVFEK